jgi:hypothetical protein
MKDIREIIEELKDIRYEITSAVDRAYGLLPNHTAEWREER